MAQKGTPESVRNRRTALKVAGAASALALTAVGFHEAGIDPTAPPRNTDPSFTRNVNHDAHFLPIEQQGHAERIEVHVQSGPASVPETVQIGSEPK